MTLEHLEIFEQAIKPAAFIGDAGKESRYHDGLIISSCPKCRSDMWVLPSGFLCSSKACTFRAGAPLDYTALELGDGTYVRAVTQLWHSHSEGLEYFAAFSPDDIIPGIAQAARLRRQLFEFFLRLSLMPPKVNAQIASALSWLRKRNINPAANTMSAVPVSDAELKELLKIAAGLGFRGGVRPGGAILFPFYGNHHSVAEIVLWSTRGGGIDNISALPFKFSFGGLLEGTPFSSVMLCAEKIGAAALNTAYAAEKSDKIACPVHHNRSGTMSPLELKNPCFLFEPEVPVGPVAAYAKVTPSLRVKLHELRFADGGVTKSWAQFMLQEIVRILDAEGFSENARMLLDTTRLGMAEMARLISTLRQKGLHEVLEEFERYLQQTPVFQQDSWSLFSTPAGYYASRGDDVRKAVTNFTINLDSNLVFTDSPDLFHSGSISFQGNKYPILLDHRHLDNPKDLEAVVRGAESKASKTDEVDVLPAVVDNKALRLLVGHLRTMSARLPRAHGLSYLGWNRAKTRFCAPSWQTKDGRKFDMQFTFHPDSEVLRAFSPEAPENIALRGKLPPGLCGMIAQLVAMTARTYMCLPVRPIRIQDSQEARRVLQALFRGLGQKDIYRLAFNVRYAEEIRHLHGYPILASGYSSGQIDKSTLPAFILADTGIEVTGNPQPAELSLAASVLRRGLQDVVLWLLKTEGKQFTRQRSISNDVELTREGQWLLKTVCGFEQWPDAPIRYQMLERLLQEIPAEMVPNYFQHHLAGQKVYFSYTSFGNTVDLTTLELELRSRCEVFIRTPTFFVMDALTATQILNNFYQEQAFPDPVPDPPLEPSSPGQAIPPSIGGLG